MPKEAASNTARLCLNRSNACTDPKFILGWVQMKHLNCCEDFSKSGGDGAISDGNPRLKTTLPRLIPAHLFKEFLCGLLHQTGLIA